MQRITLKRGVWWPSGVALIVGATLLGCENQAQPPQENGQIDRDMNNDGINDQGNPNPAPDEGLPRPDGG